MGRFGWFLHVFVIFGGKIFHLEHIPAVRKTIFRDHILSQCRVCMDHIHRRLSVHPLRKLFAQYIDEGLNHWLEPPNRRFGEETTESGAAPAMNIVANSPKGHVGAAKHTRGPGRFLHILGDGRIELVYKVRVYDMELVRIDADDRTYREYQRRRNLDASSFKSTVDLVHFLDFPNVRASFNDIEVELVPEGQSGQLPTGEMSNRRKIKTIDDSVDGIKYQRYCGEVEKESMGLHIDRTISRVEIWGDG